MKLSLSNKFKSSGFTLVELLVVIAVLGVLAAGVLVAINPLEQLARGRDTGRVSAVTELGRALSRNYTNNGGTFLASSTSWIDGTTASLMATGDVKVAPTNPSGSTCAPAANNDNEFCYVTGSYGTPAKTEAIIYAAAESNSYKTKASCTASGSVVYIVYSSELGKTGLICKTSGNPALGDVSTLVSL